MISTRFIAAIPALAIAGALAVAFAAPPKPTNIRVLTATDRDVYTRAYETAAKGDWIGARALAGMGSNPLPRQLLEWRYGRVGNASFAEVDAILKAVPANWPGRPLLFSRAEQAIGPELGPAEIAAWFGTRTPATSIGRIRLGGALIATGQTTRGQALVREGWRAGTFDPNTELGIVQNYGSVLTAADDRARLEALLWRGEITAARRVLARLSGDTVVARARIALAASGAKGARTALEAVSGSSDAALLYDWSAALRRDGQNDAAHAMLLRIPAGALKDHADRWWAEHNIQARDALNDNDPREALEIVRHAGLSAGADYSEQQFLGGFIQLRFLKNAALALPWFQRMEAAVARPISKAKAQYWQGRALEASGDTTAAMAQYRRAGAYGETFYGQLALAKTGGVIRLTDAALEPAPDSEMDASALMPAIKVLAELGQSADLRLFVDAELAANPGPRRMKAMMQRLSQWGYLEIAVRVAKTLGYDGSLVLAYSHPVIALPSFAGSGTPPPQPLVLGLIRQESEFDPYAVSSAGAQGIMQVMPATARAQAKVAGLAFRADALVGDPEYSIRLGMSEISTHLTRYGGSLPLAIAAYNAGPGNATRWVRSNGDPRLPGTDPIDWIERISFPETRNYVARVLENAGAYRARLAGGTAAPGIVNDLYAPTNPPPSPAGP
jgi:soluble lytic murein transglycosylase